jgi:hypothetical protein
MFLLNRVTLGLSKQIVQLRVIVGVALARSQKSPCHPKPASESLLGIEV